MIHLILFFRIIKIQFKNVYLIYFHIVYIYIIIIPSISVFQLASIASS